MQNKLMPLIVIVLIILGIGGYLIYQNQNKSLSPSVNSTTSDSQKTFALGNFTLSLPSSEIVESTGDFYGKINSTKLTGGECDQIEGVNSLYLEKTYPQAKEGYSKPILWFIEWNTKDLKFVSKESAQSFTKIFAGFNKLSDYQDEAKLRDLVLTDKTSEISSTAFRLNGCGEVGFSIPFLVKKIDTDKFSSVYFLEVTEGNGDVYSYPTRTLVINHNDSWIIVKEKQGVSPDNYLCVKDSKKIVPPEEYLKCAIDTWAKEHRNEAENQIWIQKMLNTISYK